MSALSKLLSRWLTSISAAPWALVVLGLLFWMSALRHLELPGLYMDAINPDYLVARWQNDGLPNTVWTLPGPRLPLLGNLYHGTQNLYVGLFTYGWLGNSVASAHLSHGLFGFIIVLLAYLLARRLTGRPLVAFVAIAGLATDMAFIGAFRTPGYIVLGGQAWMLGALLLAFSEARGRARALAVLASGACMGLAVYGYFVHLFYAPVVALSAIIATDTPDGPPTGAPGWRRRTLWWCLGFSIGLLPYAIGYLWAAHALGGWGPFREWLGGALTSLQPVTRDQGYLDGVLVSLRNLRLALGGTGNELVMTGEPITEAFSFAHAGLFGLSIAACGWLAWSDRRRAPEQAKRWLAIAALPIAFVAASGVFGARLWVHHFTVLVAIGYLALLAVFEIIVRILAGGQKLAKIYAGVATLLVLVGFNAIQQERVFHRLVETGGVGKSSEMIAILAKSAMPERSSAVYFFPEWGFFMPFAFLTGNQVSYEVELNQASLARHRGVHDDVRVAFWDASDREMYETLLLRNGVEHIRLYTFAQRDGKPAFFLLAGSTAAGKQIQRMR